VTAGTLAGLGAAAIWGGMYVVSKYVLDVVPAFGLVWLRLAIGTAALSVVAVATGAPKVHRSDLGTMALLGAVGMLVSMNAQFLGTRLSTAANGALITSATPAFLVLFAWPLLGEPLTRWRVAGLAVATIGVVVTIVLDPSFEWSFGSAQGGLGGAFLGNALLVVAAVTWALYSVLAGAAARRYPVLVTTLYATAFGALFTLPAAAELDVAAVPPLAWAGIAYLGVVSTAVAFYLWNKSILILGAGLPAVLFFAQPVVGGLLGALLLGETLGAGFFVGGALIVAGVLITARESR
jgi:drug/metabolite transporter (DMT)-like permease